MRQENWSVRKLRKLLDNKIAAVENVMREGLESASTDYCRFFEWKAAYLYKGELLRGHYRLLRNKVSRTDDVEDLKKRQNVCLDTLLRQDIAARSTSPMANMAHTLRLECVQQLVEDYGHFIRILADTLRQQETRRDTRTLREKENRRGPKL